MRRASAALALGATLFPGVALAQATAHLGGGGAAADVSIVRVLASLILCLGMAVAVILLMRGRGIRVPTLKGLIVPAAPGIEIIQTRRLSTHADISLVRHSGREYLLLLQAGSAQILRESDVAERPHDA